MNRISLGKYFLLFVPLLFLIPEEPAAADCKEEDIYICTEWYPSGDCKKTIKGTHTVCDSDLGEGCFTILDCVEWDANGTCTKQEEREHCPRMSTGNFPAC